LWLGLLFLNFVIVVAKDAANRVNTKGQKIKKIKPYVVFKSKTVSTPIKVKNKTIM